MAIRFEELKFLDPPYEIFEFEPCTPAYFKVVDYQVGKITITPRWPGAPKEKVVIAIRLYLDPYTKKYFPKYWDITPSRLVYQLASILTAGIPDGMWLKIHRDVAGPKAHFLVQWVSRPE